jgi:hypothetical protein
MVEFFFLVLVLVLVFFVFFTHNRCKKKKKKKINYSLVLSECSNADELARFAGVVDEQAVTLAKRAQELEGMALERSAFEQRSLELESLLTAAHGEIARYRRLAADKYVALHSVVQKGRFTVRDKDKDKDDEATPAGPGGSHAAPAGPGDNNEDDDLYDGLTDARPHGSVRDDSVDLTLDNADDLIAELHRLREEARLLRDYAWGVTSDAGSSDNGHGDEDARAAGGARSGSRPHLRSSVTTAPSSPRVQAIPSSPGVSGSEGHGNDTADNVDDQYGGGGGPGGGPGQQQRSAQQMLQLQVLPHDGSTDPLNPAAAMRDRLGGPSPLRRLSSVDATRRLRRVTSDIAVLESDLADAGATQPLVVSLQREIRGRDDLISALRSQVTLLRRDLAARDAVIDLRRKRAETVGTQATRTGVGAGVFWFWGGF